MKNFQWSIGRFIFTFGFALIPLIYSAGLSTARAQSETIGGGTITSPAVGPAPSYGIGGSGFTLVKNWHFGTDGTITNISDLNANFQYHDQFNTYNNGNGNYGANIVAPDSADALSGQPIEYTDTTGPVRQFYTDSMQTYLVPLDGATTVTPSSHNAGSGSFQAKWTLPNGGSLLGQDVIWETRVRYVVPPYFWFAIWTCGNEWSGGAEFDLIESFGYNNGGGYTNYNGQYWHSNSVGGGDQVDYSNWGNAMSSLGINNYDTSQYHIWTMAYYADNSYAFYVDGIEVQHGSNYNWTLGATAGGTPVNMSFIFDGSWGSTAVSSCNYPLAASALSGMYYEWNYSRVYLRNASTFPNGTYKLVNAYSGQLASLDGGSPTSNGDNILQWSDVGSPLQTWTITSSGGQVQIENTYSGQYMSIDGSSPGSDGDNVHQWPWLNSPMQLWTLVPSGGAYKIINLSSGKLLSIDGSSPSSTGDNVHQWEDVGSSMQLWNLVRQ